MAVEWTMKGWIGKERANKMYEWRMMVKWWMNEWCIAKWMNKWIKWMGGGKMNDSSNTWIKMFTIGQIKWHFEDEVKGLIETVGGWIRRMVRMRPGSKYKLHYRRCVCKGICICQHVWCGTNLSSALLPALPLFHFFPSMDTSRRSQPVTLMDEWMIN